MALRAVSIAARSVAVPCCGRMSVFCGLQADGGNGDRRGRIGEEPFGVAARRRPLVGGALRRRLRALAAVERVIEREAIVALADGLLRVRERIDGALQLFGRVDGRARGSRGVDGALGLMQFLVRRFAARDDQQTRAAGSRRAEYTAVHHRA